MHRTLAFSLLVALGSVACGDHAAPSPPRSSAALDGRTYVLKVPSGYDGSHPLPLIVATHGYGGTGATLVPYFGLDPVADERGFFVVYPDGSVDESGRRFFSATDACCDFYETGVDDVAFIDALVDHIEAMYSIDPTRVYAVGYSNGGFMSYRLACDLSPRFAAIVSLEGAMWNDPSKCRPTMPVAILEVHGSQTMGSWAALDHCPGTTIPGVDPGVIDGETSQPTTSELWTGGTADVELWENQGGTHSPALTPAWPEAIVDFLMAHPRGGTDAIAAQ
jgi:polyhydroxybutyrate depolymerase